MFFGKKKEDVFFTLFKQYSEKLCMMGSEFDQIISEKEKSNEKMKAFESECDSIKHKIINQLNDSFVTPIDREDIFVLAGQLDDIADYMEDISSKLQIYNIRALKEEAQKLGRIIVDMTKHIDVLITALPDGNKNNEAKKAIIEINSLEDQGDQIFRNALTQLFRQENSSKELIIWKDILEILEQAVDSCEHLADTVEGILTKNA